jgi:hypothetical protein
MVGDTGITNSSDIEMSNAHNNNEVDDINTESNIDSDDEGNNNDNNNNYINGDVANPMTKQENLEYDQFHHQQQQITGNHDENDFVNNNDDNEEDYPLLGDVLQELTWIRVGRAIDRICRVAIPIAFSIGTIQLYSEH